MWFYIFIIVIILIIIYAFIMYNSLIKLDNKVKEAFSTMDVYLKKRWDLIPNIVEVVKGYAKHESNTLKETIELRNTVYENMSNESKIKTNEKLTDTISKLMLLAEDYPDLKANNNFNDLSDKLTKIEDEIASSRKYYNAVVRIYNNKVEIFPNNIFASIYGYKTKAMFEVSKDERNNIKVEL